MKPFQLHSASCSCTGCVYRSRSKEPNVQQIIQGGSEIDKLYYGKFLPLRERKLLEKLIRTRDVYDSVRSQLLSSASSDHCPNTACPGYKKHKRDDSITDTSSTVLEMVERVDRGHMSGHTSKLSSCCSCCSCETLRKIRRRMEKEQKKHPRVHRHIVTCEDIAKYCAEAEERGRKRRGKLSTKISSKIGSARLKIKKHLSEPCACAGSLSSASTHASKHFRNKIRSKRKAKEAALSRKVITIDQETDIAKVSRKPRKIGKNIQSSTTKDSGTSVKSPIAFKIKKDSIILFKEKLLKKRTYDENQDVECKPGTCDVGKCMPDECVKKIKVKVGGVVRKRKSHGRHFETGRDRSHVSVSLRTKKVKVRQSRDQHEPSPHEICPCPHGPCLCESKRKSFYSMTTILKSKLKQSVSKVQLKGKKPVSEKPRQNFEKTIVKQDKSSKLSTSAASMTPIPKSKTKAQSAITDKKAAHKSKLKAKLQLSAKDKGLEEKEKVLVQVAPKSDLGNIICECKPSTKSTPSVTSSPKQKASKSGPKISRQKSKRELHQNLDEADLQEPKEHIKATREKRMKPTHGRMKQRKKQHHIKTQSKTSQESHLREFASQASEFYRRNVLPFPRECEPLMCIPYECDPEKCAEILLSRSKSRGKHAITSTDRLRRKSVGSTAFSQKTSSRSRSKSRSKSKHNVSKSAEGFAKKTQYISMEPPPEIVEKDTGAESYYPDRQAVKISSSFSFNIEFYKDTFPGEECVCVETVDKNEAPVSGHQEKIKEKEYRKRYKDHGTGYISSKDHGTGYISSQQNTSSQSSSSQSYKNIQVAHKLKRCFCTLKLQKKKQKASHAVSKKTMASFQNKVLETGPKKKRTQTKLSGIAYVVPPSTSPRASLLPYECEPDFCTPGECNPYECAERIKQRNRRAAKHVSKETNTAVTPRVSTFTSQSVSKSTSKRIQSKEPRKKKQKGRHSQSQNIEPKVEPIGEPKISSDKSERQAVRIGSSLSLSIEFSKSNINDDTTTDVLISDKLRKKEGRKHLQQKGIKAHKPRVRHEISETTTSDVKTKQTYATRDIKTKQTYTEPFLQRCLCTLKLMKKNKKKLETLSPWRNKNEYVMHMQKESVTTNRAEIRYNHERSEILPYACGTGLCSYPYDCEKFIKMRQMRLQHKYLNLVDLGSRPKFSKTSKTINSSKPRKTQFLIRQSLPTVKKINRDYYEMNSCSKQRVKQVGSNLSNNLIDKRAHNKVKLNTIESQQLNRSPHYTSKDAEANSKEKESSVVSTIKRYFSTLKFQKKRNKAGLENKSNVTNERIKTLYPLPNSQICDYKTSRTRLSKCSYDTRGHECALNSCIPGLRDPCEFYQVNKRQKIKGLHNHYISTSKCERISNMSITTSDFSDATNAKCTQSRLLKHKTTKDQKVRDKQKYMKTAVSFSPSPQAVRKGSVFSLNKEISKNRFVSIIQDTKNRESYRAIHNRAEKYNTVSEISTVNTIKNKDAKDKHVALKHCISHANEFSKEVKTSKVGFLLKKCLCTLGLQKKNSPISELRWQQPVTTQFVQVEHNRNKINMYNVTKPGMNALNKSLYGEEPLKSNIPKGGYLFKENFNRNQNSIKNPHESNPQRLPNSSSYSKRVHVRSSIDLNFDKMRSLMNPFYKSFYALNVKISKSKNKSYDKYRGFNENERAPGDCAPKECDPIDCSKRMNRLKRLKLAMTPSVKPESDCYEKCKEQFLKNKKRDKSEDKPVILGSDMSIRAGVYRDKDPYKNKRQKAIRVGSDIRVNFDFFKEPHTRNMCVTGPLPPKPKKVRREARPKRRLEETDSNASVLSNTLQKCFCKAKLKKAYSTKSDINQNADVTKTGKDCTCPKRKSTPRLFKRKQNLKSNQSLKSKSVQYKDYTQQQHKHSRRKDRNNVRFCNNVNCLEYYDGHGQKQRVGVRGRGDGDAEKWQQYGREQEKTTVDQCLCKKDKKKPKKINKKKKLKQLIDKCYCKLKQGKKLGQKQSMETIDEKKICKHLERAEREMETIMPYSKKKFKKIDSRPDVAKGKRTCPKCRTNSVAGLQISKDEDNRDNKDNTCLCPPPLKNTKSFNCECSTAYKCPVCRAKEAGTFNFKKIKQPCTCMEEPKVEDPKKDLSKCPMCKQNYKKNVSTCPCCKKPFASGTGVTNDAKEKKKALDLNKPLFQMTVNKTNMRIVNKDEVIKKMGSSAKAMQRAQKALDSTKYHSSKCKCCICVAKRKSQLQPGLNFNIDYRKLKPCICGSVVCKKDVEKLQQEQRSRAAVKLKKCVCGSNVCGEESQKMPEMLLEAAKQAEHDKEMVRRAKLKEVQYQNARKKRRKEREKEFKEQSKLRKKDDKRQMKSIRKSVNAGDIALVADSLIDLGTFGSKAFCDIAKYVYKGIIHPRDAISDVKEAISDPGQAMKTIAKSAEGMGLHTTMKRIKERFVRMPVAASAISVMESNPMTNYLVHIADKDPKKRMKQFKTKRFREPLDFQCSLYMASMRKRPCLRVYYMCPWFYPHFMSLLQMWKQFMDVLLFILAVLVWSPCILCMELCRGCVCCLACQG